MKESLDRCGGGGVGGSRFPFRLTWTLVVKSLLSACQLSGFQHLCVLYIAIRTIYEFQ